MSVHQINTQYEVTERSDFRTFCFPERRASNLQRFGKAFQETVDWPEE